MIEPETDLPRVDRMERPTEMLETLAAVIAITRRAWLPRAHAFPALDETVVNPARCEQPSSGLALDA